MVSSFASSDVDRRDGMRRTLVVAAVALAIAAFAGCGKDASSKKQVAVAASPWASKATDNVVLKWRERCGKDAVGHRLGDSIQLDFKSGTLDVRTVCSLQYREATREMVSASVVLSAAAPPATLYGQRALIDKLVRDLIVTMLPEPSQAALTAALDAKKAGEFDLEEGLRAQIIQREDTGLLTVAVNVHLAAAPVGGATEPRRP